MYGHKYIRYILEEESSFFPKPIGYTRKVASSLVPPSPHLFSWCLHPTVKDLGRRLDLSRTLVLLRPHPWIRNEERQFYIPVSQMESLKTNQCFKNRTKPNRARLGHTAVFHRFCFHYPTVVREGLAWTIFMTLILEKKNSPPLEKKKSNPVETLP